MIKSLISYFTPMTQVKALFVDRVSGKTVYLWEDKYGTQYMNTHSFGWGRVKYCG